MAQQAFCGFPPETLRFLVSLKRNNNRDWFNQRKPRYESDVLEPSLAFITAMQKPMKALSAYFPVIPKRTGGSLMRVYRDTRFSKDKTPYKTNIGIHFRHDWGRDVHAPGFYVHIEPTEVFLGAGLWHPDAGTLTAVRERIMNETSVWKRVRDNKAFRKHFTLEGDSLKRPPRGVDALHPMLEDLKRKDLIGVSRLAPQVITRPDFVSTTMTGFKSARPLMRFLCESLELPF